MQVLRRLVGLGSPSLGRGKVNTARIAELTALNAFRDVAHTFMSRMEDVPYIREAIRLFQACSPNFFVFLFPSSTVLHRAHVCFPMIVSAVFSAPYTVPLFTFEIQAIPVGFVCVV